MSLIIYNFEFEPIFEEKKVKRSNWDIYYNKTGTFEAHLPLTSELVGITSENRYLVAAENGKKAIITGREIGDGLTLYGRTPDWLLGKRIAPKTELITADAGVICKELVENAFSDVLNFETAVPAEIMQISVERTSLQTVLQAVGDCLIQCGYGYKLDFDINNSKWVFTAYAGREIPLLISEANKNAYDTSICDDILDLADGGYYGDDGYISGENSGIYRWDALLDSETESEARLRLAENKQKSSISLKLRNLKFGIDYRLGDILRVQITKGSFRTAERKMISGVHISNNGRFTEETPILEDAGGVNNGI